MARSAPREALLPAENLVTALGAASPNEAQHIADFLAAPLPLAVSMSQPTGAIRGLKLAGVWLRPRHHCRWHAHA